MTAPPAKQPLSDLAVTEVPLGALTLYPGNARRGDIEKIAASLAELGQYRPIIVRRETSEILAGNHTYQAAQLNGQETILVQYLDGLTDQQARKIVLADNKTSDAGDYDNAALARLLAELEGDHAGIGFDDSEITELLAELEGDPAKKTEPDSIPDMPGPAYPTLTSEGDVWLLGPHRLVIGDSTDPDVVTTAVGGERAKLLVTDPPYNVAYEGKTAAKLTIDNDAMGSEAFAAFLTDALTAAAAQLVKGGPAYIYYGMGEVVAFRAAMAAAGILYKEDLVWVKDRFVLSRQDYHWQHEPILYGWKAGAAHRWFGGFTPSTLIDENPDPRKLSKAELLEIVQDLYEHTTAIREERPARNEHHPTSKPVRLLSRHLENSSQPGDLVLDIFAGSGSTLIAAHGTRRRSALVELDPRFGDLICRRWQEHTGVLPVRAAAGRRKDKPHDFVRHYEQWKAA